MEKSTIDFFLTKGKRKKRERFFDPKNKKKKKIEGGGHWFFCRFLGQEIFFQYFPTLKKNVTVTLLL
jgi:hypothetical protein